MHYVDFCAEYCIACNPGNLCGHHKLKWRLSRTLPAPDARVQTTPCSECGCNDGNHETWCRNWVDYSKRADARER